jgi:hypothetical protein
MQFLRIFVAFVVALSGATAVADDSAPADAQVPEHVRGPISELDHPDFERREATSDQLFAMGLSAIPAIVDAAESPSPEISVRAIEILQRFYRGNDEAIFEAVETAFARLKASDHLAVAARAERAFDSGAETRQKRAIVQFERLGGIIHYSERGYDRQPLARPILEYVMLGRDWVGGDEGLRLLTRIEDIRLSGAQLYIIRGIEISEDTLLDLSAELPYLVIQRRGPARLGIRGSSRDIGCVVRGIDPGSAAELAGLKIQDEVVEIDGQQINSFDGLIEIVGEKEPGDEIPIVFRRGSETREVNAKLSAWVKSSNPKAPAPRP